MNKPKTYYANQLLGTQKQQLAADRFLALLTLQEVLSGLRGSYLAMRWGREGSVVYGLLGRARGLVYNFTQHPNGLDDFYAEYAGDAVMLPLSAIRADFKKFRPAMEAVEAVLLKDLNDPSTEKLIRQMFDKEPTAVFASHRSPNRRRKPWEESVKVGPGRPLGRPPGSKNKPKDVKPEGDAWPLPNGYRLPPAKPAAPTGEWD